MNNCSCASDFLNTSLSDMEFENMSECSNQNAVLARIYVPMQNPGRMYSLCEALNRGTIFPCLDQPYDMCGDCEPGFDGEAVSHQTYFCKKEAD